MSEPDIVHCPFCGALQNDIGDADNDAYFAKGSDQTLSVSCRACGAIGPSARTRAEAIAAWNAALAQSRAETQAALAVLEREKTDHREAVSRLGGKIRAANAERDKILAAIQPDTSKLAQCCMCGKNGLSTVEDGGPECELSDGRWVCSSDCYERAIQPDTSKLALVREAFGSLVNHDAFQDDEYMSEDLVAKLADARAALALITAQEGK